ncbi:MAG: hypothetical protein IKH33_03440 [Bacteroidales bacterium]|nr:hypothetical protein [Bacteroidales bacterium]
MSTIQNQIESLIENLPEISTLTLSDIEGQIHNIVNLLLKDDDALHRLFALKILAEYSNAALNEQNLCDLESRFADMIKIQIERQNNIINLKNKEWNEVITACDDRMSGIRQHEELVKKVSEQLDNLKDNDAIKNIFSEIESKLSSVEEILKEEVNKRRNLPMESLSY